MLGNNKIGRLYINIQIQLLNMIQIIFHIQNRALLSLRNLLQRRKLEP